MRSVTLLILILIRSPVFAVGPPPSFQHLALGEIPRTGKLEVRQEELVTNTVNPTSTLSEIVDTTTHDEQRPTKTLTPVAQPLTLAATIGLIMPNPWEKNYVGVNYTFGFIDAVARPAPTIGGWLRHVQPVLVFPNYTVNGTYTHRLGAISDVRSTCFQDPVLNHLTIPAPYRKEAAGYAAENWVKAYKFMFIEPGWYMFVVNQTWLQPTIISNTTCRLPVVSQKSFFATQTISIAPAPTHSGPPLPDPTAAYTVFADVTTATPGDVPYDDGPITSGQKLAIGFGITGGVVALACIAGVIWWVRKKHKMEREATFSRLSETDRAAFLAENPDHFLNPNRPSRRSQRWSGGGWGDKNGPPAPPGTMAYAQWYMAQMRNRQLGGLGGWRWGLGRQPQSYVPATHHQAPWATGYGYQGVPAYAPQVPMSQATMPLQWPIQGTARAQDPVLVYRT